jgi:hypothetical protein
MHTATSKVENSAQDSSCKLKFVHGLSVNYIRLEKFVTDKCSSLLDQFVCYDENEVL